nr:ribonuclease H-like domain-containing protein [Tanacetum cinerariifolium]
MIDDLDKDEGIELVVDQVKDADTAKTEGRHAAEQAEKQAEIYHLDLDHLSKVLSMQEDDLEVQEVVEVVTTAKLITEVVTAATCQVSAVSATIFAAKPSIPAAAPIVVAAFTRRRKGVIIRDPEEELSFKTHAETPKLKDKGKEINKDHEEINKDMDWDAAIDHVKQKSKENPQYIKRYQNTAGYKLDFFKGMSYDEIRPIFQARFDANMRFLLKSREEIEEEDREVLKSINETPTQKVAKRRKLNEKAQEVEDLKKHLEVVNDENDDVFIEATLLARKDYNFIYYEAIVDEPGDLMSNSNIQENKNEEMDQDSAHMMATSKFLMLKPENGATLPKTQVVEVVTNVMPITSVEDKAQRRLEVKSRCTLIMGNLNKHQLKFNSIKDAKKLLEAVKKRFGGNAATKKTQKIS